MSESGDVDGFKDGKEKMGKSEPTLKKKKSILTKGHTQDLPHPASRKDQANAQSSSSINIILTNLDDSSKAKTNKKKQMQRSYSKDYSQNVVGLGKQSGLM